MSTPSSPDDSGRFLSERDCSPDPIRGWTLAVLGYGHQGRAQAWNLRDSGFAVLVSARPGGPSAEAASADGFGVVAPRFLPEAADLIAVLLPDEVHRAAMGELTSLSRRGGRIRALVLAHGFSLRFDAPDLDPSWDVVVVAPAGPGAQLRERFVDGHGLPALLAIHRDASSTAEAVARAYAAGIGCARAGLLRVSVSEEAEIDLFGEQAVLCGGMNALCQAAFETLVQAGYPPEAAYLECIQQLRLTAELVERHGPEGMRRRISPTALWGDLSRGPRLIDAAVRARLAEVLEEIRSGAFAREWLELTAKGPDWVERELRGARHEALERAGARVRALYGDPSGGSKALGKGVDSPGPES